MPNWYTQIKDKEIQAGKVQNFMRGVGLSGLLAAPALVNSPQIAPPKPAPPISWAAPAPIKTKPTALPSTQPTTKPTSQPASQPTTKPSTQPATKPAKPSVKIDVNKIISIESNGNSQAVNNGSGASGAMQIMAPTWKEIVNKLGHGSEPDWSFEQGKFDKAKNIAVGSYYMNVEIPRLLKSFSVPDTVETRLAAYNWGISGLQNAYQSKGDQWLTAAPQETQDYVKKYLSR